MPVCPLRLPRPPRPHRLCAARRARPHAPPPQRHHRSRSPAPPRPRRLSRRHNDQGGSASYLGSARDGREALPTPRRTVFPLAGPGERPSSWNQTRHSRAAVMRGPPVVSVAAELPLGWRSLASFRFQVKQKVCARSTRHGTILHLLLAAFPSLAALRHALTHSPSPLPPDPDCCIREVSNAAHPPPLFVPHSR